MFLRPVGYNCIIGAVDYQFSEITGKSGCCLSSLKDVMTVACDNMRTSPDMAHLCGPECGSNHPAQLACHRVHFENISSRFDYHHMKPSLEYCYLLFVLPQTCMGLLMWYWIHYSVIYIMHLVCTNHEM